MRRRIALSLLLLLAVVTIGLLIFFPYSREPVYQGKRLTRWVDELNKEGYELWEQGNFAAADSYWAALTNVIRAIGTNGLPVYLEWMQDVPRPMWSDESDEWLRRYSRGHFHLPQHRFHVLDAVGAFQILGPVAEPAIPDLAKMLTNEIICEEVARSLAAIGPAAVPALSNAVVMATTNRVRLAALTALGEIGPVAKPAVPLLLQLVSTGDPAVADFTLRTLAEVETNADILMPLLVEGLADTNTAPGAAYGLARVGTQGLPILLQALTNEDRRIRLAAGAALYPRFQGRAAMRNRTIGFRPRFESLNRSFNHSMEMLGGNYATAFWEEITRVLEQYSSDTDVVIRSAASDALQFLGSTATNSLQMPNPTTNYGDAMSASDRARWGLPTTTNSPSAGTNFGE